MDGPYGLPWLTYKYTEYLLVKYTLSLLPFSSIQVPARQLDEQAGGCRMELLVVDCEAICKQSQLNVRPAELSN
jgi:hypothetical protein